MSQFFMFYWEQNIGLRDQQITAVRFCILHSVPASMSQAELTQDSTSLQVEMLKQCNGQ